VQAVPLRATLLGLMLACPLAACGGPPVGTTHAELAAVAAKHDALALSDALEALIAEGRDTLADREFAYQQISAHEEPGAAYAFARAAVKGRYIQIKGVTVAAQLAGEVEVWASKSRELDPSFRNFIATRMLGTLYVLAPATLLHHGNSEDGLTLLDDLVKAHPEVPENHLRLAEALIALGDPAPAVPHLCACLAVKASLRHDDQILLERLVKDSEMPPCPGAPAPAPAPPP
jgi:predicted Zn-dependent protease